MKHLAIAALISLLICSVANASSIKYEITGGVDPYGNDLSGYICIEDTVNVLGEWSLRYDIVDFLFESDTFSHSGNNGSLRMNGDIIELFAGFGMAILTDDDGTSWNNTGTGVFFIHENNPPRWSDESWNFVEYYSCLPEYISIEASSSIWWGLGGMGVSNNIISLNMVPEPVPEPSTILLLLFGLVGFLGKRKFSKSKS